MTVIQSTSRDVTDITFAVKYIPKEDVGLLIIAERPFTTKPGTEVGATNLETMRREGNVVMWVFRSTTSLDKLIDRLQQLRLQITDDASIQKLENERIEQAIQDGLILAG